LGLRLPVPFLRKSNFKKLYTPYFMRDVKLCFSSGHTTELNHDYS